MIGSKDALALWNADLIQDNPSAGLPGSAWPSRWGLKNQRACALALGTEHQMGTPGDPWADIIHVCRTLIAESVATKGRSLAFELGPRRTPRSTTAGRRSVLEAPVKPPFVGPNGSASARRVTGSATRE